MTKVAAGDPNVFGLILMASHDSNVCLGPCRAVTRCTHGLTMGTLADNASRQSVPGYTLSIKKCLDTIKITLEQLNQIRSGND